VTARNEEDRLLMDRQALALSVVLATEPSQRLDLSGVWVVAMKKSETRGAHIGPYTILLVVPIAAPRRSSPHTNEDAMGSATHENDLPQLGVRSPGLRRPARLRRGLLDRPGRRALERLAFGRSAARDRAPAFVAARSVHPPAA
jgi:hypothetical protein